MSAQTAQSLPYTWVEPLTRPRHGWATFRLLAVPALVIAVVAWFSFPRISAALAFDRDFAATLKPLEVLGGFELLVLAMYLLDRRKVTLDRNGLTLAGALGLLPGKTIALSSIGAVGIEGDPGTNSTLRLIPQGSGILPGDAAIGLGTKEPNVQAVLERFRMLGVTIEGRTSAKAPPFRNVILGRIIIYAFLAANFLNFGRPGSSRDETHTPAPIVVDPSIRCILAKPGGLISVDVANLERLVDIKIQDHTIGASDVRSEKLGASVTRLTLHEPAAATTNSDEADPSETLTVFSRSADGTTHSGWAEFKPKDQRPQGYQCS
jgi:hypothetical protein